MPKILFVSNTANFSKFNLPFINWFKQQGWQVDYASSGDEMVVSCDNHYVINMVRSPFSFENIKAIKKLRIILNEEKYNIIHCHTNIGAMVTRLAAKNLRKKGLKIIYTLHGAYFFKGAPLINWIIYFHVEKYLAHFTDCLITINQEDYNNIKKKLKIPSIYKINGVGIDLKKYFPVSKYRKSSLRREYGYSDNNFIIIYIAEFVRYKNHSFLLKQIPELKRNIPNLKILLAGKGILLDKCKRLVKILNMEDTIDFLGYRDDINILCQISDLHLSVSLREGLSLNNLEAMASGLPIVCSKIRGHIDVIVDGRNGFLFGIDDSALMINSIKKIYENEYMRNEFAQNNIEDVKKYSVDIALSKMTDIYKIFMHS
jgi:glycosyltransferase EpsD